MSDHRNDAPEWRVSFSVAVPPEHEIEADGDPAPLVDALMHHGAARVITSLGPDQLDLAFSLDAEEVWGALAAAARLWQSATEEFGLQEWLLQSVRATTPDRIRAENEKARLPQLMGVAEVADRL